MICNPNNPTGTFSPWEDIAALAESATGLQNQLAGFDRTLDLLKPPGIAESLDWAAALLALGARRLDVDAAARTLGAVLKYREDTDRVTTHGLAQLVGG